MIDFIHAQAMEKFAGNKEAADSFVEGFLEKASFNLNPETYGELFQNEGVRNLAKAGVGIGAGLLGAGLIGAINHYHTTNASSELRSRFINALAQVMATNRVVKGASSEKAKAYAETIFKFAPNVAADANLLSSILANAVLGEGIDQMTIKSLVDLEGRYLDNSNPNQLQSFKV